MKSPEGQGGAHLATGGGEASSWKKLNLRGPPAPCSGGTGVAKGATGADSALAAAGVGAGAAGSACLAARDGRPFAREVAFLGMPSCTHQMWPGRICGMLLWTGCMGWQAVGR